MEASRWRGPGRPRPCWRRAPATAAHTSTAVIAATEASVAVVRRRRLPVRGRRARSSTGRSIASPATLVQTMPGGPTNSATACNSSRAPTARITAGAVDELSVPVSLATVSVRRSAAAPRPRLVTPNARAVLVAAASDRCIIQLSFVSGSRPLVPTSPAAMCEDRAVTGSAGAASTGRARATTVTAAATASSSRGAGVIVRRRIIFGLHPLTEQLLPALDARCIGDALLSQALVLLELECGDLGVVEVEGG